MKQFFLRLTLFLSPVLTLLALNALVIPVDAIYFRCWEAFTPKIFFDFYHGPFYSGMTAEKVEPGDLAPHTSLAVRTRVVWKTDNYGYRTAGTDKTYSTVIIGDSNTVGSHMTQDDTLAVVLEKRIGRPVYPFAPAVPSDFLVERRFNKHLTRTVILAMIERGLPGLKAPPLPEFQAALRFRHKLSARIKDRLSTNPAIDYIVNLVDRSFDPALVLKYFPQKITGKLPPPVYGYKAGEWLFLQGVAANAVRPAAELQDAVDSIDVYNRIFQEIGIRMIFVPIPNKENIYYRMLPGGRKPTFLTDLITQVRNKGVTTVDLETPFRAAYENDHLTLYHTDDSHWGPLAVQVAARAIADSLAAN